MWQYDAIGHPGPATNMAFLNPRAAITSANDQDGVAALIELAQPKLKTALTGDDLILALQISCVRRVGKAGQAA